jgi:ABC-type enterochelin transport system substrate-binding protein
MRKCVNLVTAITILLITLVSVQALAQEAVRTGEITAIAADTKSFTVKTARGETNIVTTDSTVITEGDKTLTFADLKVGDSVKVTGTRSGSDVEAGEVARQAK